MVLPIWASLRQKNFFKPDLLNLHVAYPLGQVALLWKKLYGYNYVMTEHWSIYQPQNKDCMVGGLKKKIINIANNASHIMPVSINLQRCMEDYGIHNRFQVIYNLVYTDTFKLGTPHHAEKKQILHISTLRDEVKNFSGILRVVQRLRQQRQDFELHVIHDYDAPKFKSFVKEHCLEDCVIFHGKKTSEEVAHAYQEADFFVLFSNFENLPCVIVEAFASGVPVLSSAVGGIAEILTPERGILVPSGDEDALLQGMNTMLDSCQYYNRKAIRNYAVSTFSNKIVGQQIFEVYKRQLI